jgi:hypothetical protein
MSFALQREVEKTAPIGTIPEETSRPTSSHSDVENAVAASIEPIHLIWDHASSGDDDSPQEERNSASESRAWRRNVIAIPFGDAAIDRAISSDPSNIGGVFITASGFVSDAVTLGDVLTINAGVRFDHSRAISQDLHALDTEGQETGDIVDGLGTLYSWNIWSPRLGLTMKLSADGRTMLRGSYGRFSQGVLTGELSPFHSGAMPTTTAAFDPATGGYTSIVSVVDPRRNLRLDGGMRAPRTDEYSIGVDRELGRTPCRSARIRPQGWQQFHRVD